MQVPNRHHHSKKDQKRKLKPQALRQAKARRQALKKRLNSRDASFYWKLRVELKAPIIL
jgi:hypothetical protein